MMASPPSSGPLSPGCRRTENRLSRNAGEWGEALRERGKTREVVWSALTGALDLAKAAVSYDESGMPVEKVLPYYEKAIHSLDAAIRLLPEDALQQTGLVEHRDAYWARTLVLRAAVAGANAPPAAPLPGRQVHHSPSPRRAPPGDQSKVPLENLTLDSNHQMERPPSERVRRPYWMLRMLRQTVTEGGYLTERLFVPKGVWTQVGVKLGGFSSKTTALASLLFNIIQELVTIPPPSDALSRAKCLKALKAFRQMAQKLQLDLCRVFAYLPSPSTSSVSSSSASSSDAHRGGPAPIGGSAISSSTSSSVSSGPGGGGGAGGGAGAAVSSAPPVLKGKAASLLGLSGGAPPPAPVSASPPKSQLGRLSHMVKSVGRNVRNSAAVAYEKFGMAGKVADDDELVYYAQLVSETCSKCQLFDEWYVELERARAEGAGAGSGVEELLVELHIVADFVRDCVIDLVLRDVELLLERFLKKTRKAVTRFHWDEDHNPLAADD